MKKHEKEIAELLEKMDKFISDETPRRRRAPGLGDQVRRAAQTISTSRISPTTLIVASFILAFLALIIREVYRPAAPLASIAAVALFIGALVLSVMMRRRVPEKRWRGKVIKIESYRPFSPSSLSYRWRRIWKNLWRRPRNKY